MATGGRARDGRRRAGGRLTWLFRAPSSVTIASAPGVDQRVLCHEIRSKIVKVPFDDDVETTRFIRARRRERDP